MKENKNKQHEWRKWSQFIAFLVLVAVVVLLSGCGDDSGSEQAEESNQAAAETEVDKTAEDYEEVDTPASELEGITEEISVTEVIDGDTVVVEGENGEETVRLAMVDAPSKNLPDGTPDEYYGFKANDYTTVRLEGANVLLERAENQDDPEGRTLGYIWFKNGQNHVNFNELMVGDGLARLVTESTSNDKYSDKLSEAEAKAKSEQKNIWSIDGYVTEDGFDSSLVQ